MPFFKPILVGGYIKSSVILQKKFLSKCHACADPETFVWRAGYYRPYSGFAIEMAFRWPVDCGPTLNADFVALRVLVGSEPVLLRSPIVL